MLGSIMYDDHSGCGMVYSQWLVNLDEEVRVSNFSMHRLSAHDLTDCLSMRLCPCTRDDALSAAVSP